ncbi:MAG: hypothetical protein K2M52_04515, partial [Paramuribaculum sp.]|nr:hypothetical protein [Paramuribaculum sp.]
MKKFLPFIFAFLFFAPQHAAAETREITFFSNQWTQDSLLWTAANKSYFPSEDTSPLILTKGDGGGYFIYQDINPILFKRDSYPTNNTTTGVTYRGNATNKNQRFILIQPSMLYTLKAYGGKIKKVVMSGYSTDYRYPTGYELNGFPLKGSDFFDSHNNALNPEVDGATFTFDNIDGDFSFKYNSTTSVGISEIKITYEVTEKLPTHPPVLNINTANAKYYGLKHTPATENSNEKIEFAIPILTPNDKLIYFTNPQPYLKPVETYYTYTDLPVPAAPLASGEESPSPEEGWAKITLRSGITLPASLHPVKGPDTFKLRAIAYNEDSGWSEVTEIDGEVYRFGPPRVDIEKTCNANDSETMGEVTFNEEENTIYYTGYNPKVYLTSDVTRYTGKNNFCIRYTTNLSKPTQSSDIYVTPIQIINGTPADKPTNGTRNLIFAYSYATDWGGTMYDTNDGGYEVIRLVRKNDDEDAPSMARPIIEITDNSPTITLPGDIVGYISPDLPLKFTAGDVEGQSVHGDLEYQLFDTWQQSPDDNAWLRVPENGLKVSGKGRLFVREYLNNLYEAPYSYLDFSHIDHTELEDIQPETLADIPEGNMVKLTGKLWVRGAYNSTNAAAPGKDYQQLLFITDESGNALRVTGDYAFGDKDLSGFFDAESKMITDIVGELRGQTKGMPELHLTTTDIDYTVFLSEPQEPDTESPAPALGEGTDITAADFSKLLLLSNMTWDGDGAFETLDGNKVKVYHRIYKDKDTDDYT